MILVRRDIVPFVRRAGPIIVGVIFLVLALSPAARVKLFGEWGFRNLLRPHERAVLLNAGVRFEIGAWYQFGSGFSVVYSDTMIHVEKGPLLRLYKKDDSWFTDKHTIIEPDATGLYSVFTVELPELELELQLTLHEVNHTRVVHEEYLGEGVLVKMTARPLPAG